LDALLAVIVTVLAVGLVARKMTLSVTLRDDESDGSAQVRVWPCLVAPTARTRVGPVVGS
jgi:hypothetical protein